MALVGDAGSVFINPSGLATIKVLSLEGAFAPFPEGGALWQAAGAFRIKQFNLGGGAAYLQLPDTSAYADNVTWVGSADYRFGLIAIGASARYVSVTDTGGQVNRAFTTDAGFTMAFFDIMALAVSVQSIGNQQLSGLGVSLPTMTHLGYTLNFVDPQGTARLLTTIEWVLDRRRGYAIPGGRRGGGGVEGGGNRRARGVRTARPRPLRRPLDRRRRRGPWPARAGLRLPGQQRLWREPARLRPTPDSVRLRCVGDRFA